MSRLLKLLAAFAAVALVGGRASAAPILGIESVTVAAPNTTGTFNVYITVPQGDPSITLGGFEFTLDTSGGAQFTAVDYPASNYVFDGVSFNQTFGFPFSYDSFPNTSFTASDLHKDVGQPFGGTTINPGDKYLLGTVSFTVPPLHGPGADVYPITFGELTNLSDQFGEPIPFTFANGAITVVPEPVSVAVFAGVVGLGALATRRRRSAPAA